MKASIKTDELIRVIKALKPFVMKYNQYTDKKMEHIFIEFNKVTQEARCEALDGHRIAIEYVKCKTERSFSVYIKPFNPWKTDSTETEIELYNGYAKIDLGFYSLKFKQPEGEWYDTKKMLADTELIKPLSKIGIDPLFLTEALKGINYHGEKKRTMIETRGEKDPVIIRDLKDKRCLRLVLPISINRDED
jgi:DNA polymerase III sliding clamp (beta) subunit (PCNA family)